MPRPIFAGLKGVDNTLYRLFEGVGVKDVTVKASRAVRKMRNRILQPFLRQLWIEHEHRNPLLNHLDCAMRSAFFILAAAAGGGDGFILAPGSVVRSTGLQGAQDRPPLRQPLHLYSQDDKPDLLPAHPAYGARGRLPNSESGKFVLTRDGEVRIEPGAQTRRLWKGVKSHPSRRGLDWHSPNQSLPQFRTRSLRRRRSATSSC